jgi:predicted GNAT superfamily acetyltransferase
LEDARHLIQIPPSFQAIKKSDLGLARDWRMQTRSLFESAFAQRYTVTDLLFTGEASFYLVQKDWSADQANESFPVVVTM